MASITSGGGSHYPAIASVPPPAAAADLNTQHQTPDAAKLPAQDPAGVAMTRTRSARKSAEVTRMRLAPGSDPLSAPRSGPAPRAVIGASDQGIGLAGGRVHIWSAQERRWKPTEVTGVAGIKLGANNDQVWVSTLHGELRQVDGEGVPQPPAPFRLPDGVRDFVVSPTAAAVSYISADGQLRRQTGDGPAQHLPLPKAFDGQAASLAQTNNGDLYLASESGQVWVRPARAMLSAGAPAPISEGWARIDDAGGRDPGRPLGQLQILRDGQPGAQDRDGLLHKYDPLKHAWSPTTVHAGSDHRRVFERGEFTSWLNRIGVHPENWNAVSLNAAPRDHARMGLPSSKPGIAGHGDVAALRTTLGLAMRQLSRKQRPHPHVLSGLPSEAQQDVARMLKGAEGAEGADSAALRALALMTNHSDSLPKDAAKANDPDHNALRAVYDFRAQALGRSLGSRPPDEVNKAIAALLRLNVCLPCDHADTLIAMGKVLVDHALVKQAIDAHRAAQTGQARTDPPLSAEKAADVDALFHAGIMDRQQFERTNTVSTSLNAGMSQLSTGLARTLDPVDGKDAQADVERISARLADVVCNLRPGKESIELSFTHSKGFDLEGLWNFFNLNSKTVGVSGKHVLSTNQLPILTPLGTLSHGGTMSVEMSRTDDGVQVVLTDATSTSGSLGLRLQLRLGGVWEKAKGVVTLLAVAGAEGAVIPGGAVADSRSVAMRFKQDDEGKAQQVIADLFSGKVSLTDLVKRADSITNAKGNSFNVNAEGYVHVFAALRGIYGKVVDKPAPGTQFAASNLVVPALDQVSGKINYDSARTVQTGQDGETTHTSKSGVSGTVDFNHVSVIDISTWFSLPFGKDQSAQVQWKVPAILNVISRNLWTNKLEAGDAAVLLRADGALEAASVTVRTREALTRSAQADKPLTPELFPQLGALCTEQPALQQHLDLLNATPALRPSVTLEPTLPAMARMHAHIASLAAKGLPPAKARAEMLAFLSETMSKKDNLRIAHIDVAATRTLPRQSILAFGPLRHVRAQGHTFNEAGSSISIRYDPESGAATGFKVEGNALLGSAVRPNTAALAELG